MKVMLAWSHICPRSHSFYGSTAKNFFPRFVLLNIFLLSLNCGQKDFVNLLYEF